MTSINDVIYKSTMLAMNQACQQEQKRIWNLIKMDGNIPIDVKAKAREIIFGANKDESVLKDS